MLQKLRFNIDNEQYFVNVIKKTLLIVDTKKSAREFYHLDSVEIGEDWIVMETSISKYDDFIWDYENIGIDFNYKKKKEVVYGI